jgi:uncharacterized protein
MSKGLLVLLPPSEGKSESPRGSKLDLTKLSFAKLKIPRQNILKELIELCSKQPAKAQKLLKLSKKQLKELETNANLLRRPTAAAVEIYTGVLYEALDFANLNKAAKDWISKKVYIASAIFGMVGASDKIAAYRLSGDGSLPKLGSIKKFWQNHLAKELDKQFKDHLIFDLRSGVYASMWVPAEEIIDKYVVGKVVQKVKQNGKFVLKTVSHHNKATKGKLVAALAKSKANPKTAQELEKTLKKLGFEVKLTAKKNKSPITLTIVMP